MDVPYCHTLKADLCTSLGKPYSNWLNYLLLADFFEVLDKVGNVLTGGLGGSGLGGVGLLGDLLEGHQVLGSELSGNTGQEILERLGLVVSRDNENVGRNRGLHLGINEVDNVTVLEEQVDFLNSGDGVAAQSLQGSLKLGVVGSVTLVRSLLGSSHSTLTTDSGLSKLGGELSSGSENLWVYLHYQPIN